MPGDEYCWLTLTTNNLNDAWCDVLRGEYVYVALTYQIIVHKMGLNPA